MADLVSGALWAGLVCFSLFGWGAVLGRVARLRFSVGETACLGVGVAIACGGVLNLLHGVLPATDAGFVLLGTAAGIHRLAACDLRRLTVPTDTPARLLLLAVGLLAACATTFYCYDYAFQVADDVPAYMVFPAKMLTGTLGFEPFSERRLLTSLGGLYFLHSLILTGAGPHWLHVIDPVFALIMTIGLLDHAMRSRGVTLRRRLLVALFLLLFLPETGNLTATLLPVPLFLLVWFSLADPPVPPARSLRRRAICLAVTIAALVAIKPLYLVPLGVCLAGGYGSRMLRGADRIAGLAEAAWVAALTVMLLSPWMLASWRQTGTPLYPFLGTGFSTARFDAGVPPPWRLTPWPERLDLFLGPGLRNAPMALLAGLFALLTYHAARFGEPADRRGLARLAVWIVAAQVTILAICFGGAGEANLARYAYPVVAAALLLALGEIARVARPDRGVWVGPGAVAATVTMLCCHAAPIVDYYRTGLFNLRMLYSGPDRTGPTRHALVEAIEATGGGIGADIRRMQAAVPPGETILERIDFPFLLDFRRNRIFIADWPGAAGPAPGWPAAPGAGRLASYLSGLSIRYIAWAYANEALFPARLANDLPGDAWVRRDAAAAYRFQASLTEMMRVCPLTFDDGARAIIHLSDDCIGRLPDARNAGEAWRIAPPATQAGGAN